MRVLVLLTIAAVIYLVPVVVFETTVMPELEKLQQTYENADVIAQRAAGL